MQLRRASRCIAESGLFDVSFYLAQNPELAGSATDPLIHYLTRGWKEGLNPHPLFDTSFYLKQSPDAAANEINPLLHYLEFGGLAGRSPHPLFDAPWYLQQNPDLLKVGANPLVHYLIHGWKEGRDPHPLFETAFYLDQNPDVASENINPLLHYVTKGASEGRNPSPLFDSFYYVRRYPDVITSRANPLVGYLQCPASELRSPHPLFEAEFYSNTHPEAASCGMPLLMHYLIIGVKTLSNPHPLFNSKYYVDHHPELLTASRPDPLRHYICEGARQGADPCQLFDSSFYLEQYPDVAQAGLNPLAHYVIEGAAAGYDPNALFQTCFYLKRYPDVAASGINPLAHFVTHGSIEGRMPNPFFDSRYYLDKNPDVKRAGVNPLVHYLVIGAQEKRDPSLLFDTSRYLSDHPELKEAAINPLAHLLTRGKRPDDEPAPPRRITAPERGEAAVFPGIILVPADPDRPAIAVNRSLAEASATGQHVLILLGSQVPDHETIRTLVEGFEIDPHFGITIPRLVDSKTGAVLKLDSELGDRTLDALPAGILAEVPEYYIFPEIIGSCCLLRNTLASNLGLLDESYRTLEGALLDYLVRARRSGFRCAVMNRATVPASHGQSTFINAISWTDLLHLGTQHSDLEQTRIEFLEHESHVYESLLGRALSPNRTIRRSLLVDARGVSNRLDGTAEAVLGLCDGLLYAGHDWAITVLAEPGPAEFHKLRDRYPTWKVLTETSGDYFTGALRPSQPWWIKTTREIHRIALFNFYCILDTIAWDIFPNAREIKATWDFLASHSDGILYISQYTREHFATRFPSSRQTPGYVSYLSFDPADYRKSEVDCTSVPQDFVFVVGNAYDHKQVRPAVDLLASAFPHQRIKALGLQEHPSPSVEVMNSGQIPQSEMEHLFACAKVIVFPSLYEGFGFPVLRGLSYGRTVIARHSELLLEVASRYRGPGRLVAFRNPRDLVSAVERALGDLPFEEVPLGTALRPDEKPMDWNQIGAGVLRFLEERIEHIGASRWAERERVVLQSITPSC